MAAHSMNGNKKVAKALHILNEAAQEKRDELQQNFSRFTKTAKKAIGERGEQLREAAGGVDTQVRRNPWAYIAGAAASALAIGFVAGLCRRK
ncbi:MAG: hypothetical protein ACREH5_05565 [Candidatus Omnitrophota bacterium]